MTFWIEIATGVVAALALAGGAWEGLRIWADWKRS